MAWSDKKSVIFDQKILDSAIEYGDKIRSVNRMENQSPRNSIDMALIADTDDDSMQPDDDFDAMDYASVDDLLKPHTCTLNRNGSDATQTSHVSN